MRAQGDRERGGAWLWPREEQRDTCATREGGPGTEQSGLAGGDGHRYALRVQGHLDLQWSEWLEGMTITHEEGGTTRLEGVLVDQAALHGLLTKLRDLCLPILWVERLLDTRAEDPRSMRRPEDGSHNDSRSPGAREQGGIHDATHPFRELEGRHQGH